MIVTDDKFLNFHDTLNCGQVFRYFPDDDGFTVVSSACAAKVKNADGFAYIDTDCEEYYRNYFDLDKDYSKILSAVEACGVKKAIDVAKRYSGIRILRQNAEEAFFSFIVSQNNNIPRIKSTIEKLCARYGSPFTAFGKKFYGFPSHSALAEADIADLKAIGLGYRAEYIKDSAVKIQNGEIDFAYLSSLTTEDLKKELLKIKGIGDKVANCVTLFGFARSDSFPVDTWIEKIYREDFCGTMTDRKKIGKYFIDMFKDSSGYVQQYLFYAKREKFI